MKTRQEYINEEVERERQRHSQKYAQQAAGDPATFNSALNLAYAMGAASTIEPEVILLRAVVRELRDRLAAEAERCAKIAEERAAQYDVEERGCWSDGQSAANALREIASKIRGIQ